MMKKKLNVDGMEIEDFREFSKQHKENILKNGHYARIELITDPNSDIPFHEIELDDCSVEEVMKLYVLLKEAIKGMERDYPDECCIAEKIIGAELISDYDFDDEGE